MTYMPALMAFLHHCAAFTLVSALAVEVAVFKQPLTVLQARRLQAVDILFGMAAAALLVVGLLRVFYFEKGPSYYFANGFFHLKLTAFVLAGLISLYPTMLFRSWRTALAQDEVPVIDPVRFRRARMCMMLELTLILVILACAPLMSHGFGYFGQHS